MAAIPYNPYIVGNPIKTREMFFGREDDFQYVERKVGAARANQVLVFCGERRSGKTSILFQILGGRLGERFLPILVDMQILAGIRNDGHFWRSILRVACESLAIPGLSVESLEHPPGASEAATRVEELFDAFLRAVERVYPERIVLFLLDEYELIEEKIRDGSLSEATIHYLSGALESPHRISFVFTGSTNLENRKVSFWKALLAKSIYRKISYLSENDTARLITEPLKDYVRYSPELLQAVYRLTGGQPFYTQVICQNLVDHLMEESRSDPEAADLERIVKGIVDNPLPQMIYSWNSLADPTRLLLAALGGVLDSGEDWADATEVLQYLRRSRLGLPFSREQLLIHLEEAYHQELLDKAEGGQRYRFRMDLLRRWVRREHSIWKVAKETGIQPRSRRRMGGLIAAAAAVALLAAGYFLVAPRLGLSLAPAAVAGRGPSATGAAEQAVARAELAEVTLAANSGPFRVVIDGSLTLTSEGQEDPRRIVVPNLKAGVHRFSFQNPATEETVMVVAEVDEQRRYVEAAFKKLVAAGSPASPRKATQTASPGAQSASSAGGAGGAEAAGGGESSSGGSSAAPTGSLFLSSVPPGARIAIDGQDTNLSTPYLVEGLAAGARRITLSLEGHRSADLELQVAAGDTIRSETRLEETFGEILFDVRPTARILLDGALLVETPYVRPVRVRSGRHLLTIVNDSLGVRREREIDVPEGQTLKIIEVLQ